MKFKKGSAVKWTSQSQGYRRNKIGIVVDVIPAGSRPDRALYPALYKTKTECGQARDHESYVVCVPVSARSNKYYWPIASKLSAVKVKDMIRE